MVTFRSDRVPRGTERRCGDLKRPGAAAILPTLRGASAATERWVRRGESVLGVRGYFRISKMRFTYVNGRIRLDSAVNVSEAHFFI